MSNLAEIFELKPLLVAGAIGAVLVALVAPLFSSNCQCSASSTGMAAVCGFGIGVGVQIGVRLTGVS